MEIAVLLDQEGKPNHIVIRVNGGPMQCVCDESIIPHYSFIRYRPIRKVLVSCGTCQAHVALLNRTLDRREEERRAEREKEQAREEEGR